MNATTVARLLCYKSSTQSSLLCNIRCMSVKYKEPCWEEQYDVLSYRTVEPLEKQHPPVRKDVDGKPRTLDHNALARRHYLRNEKPYTPPANVEELVLEACAEASGNKQPDLSDKQIKFNVLKLCGQKLYRTVPNSYIADIKTIDDLMTFYRTPVDTRSPLDRMKDLKLPKNLHILYDYHRYHPETDTMFNGVSAFPAESTLVTSIKYKGKYRGYVNEPEWARYNVRVETTPLGDVKIPPRPGILGYEF